MEDFSLKFDRKDVENKKVYTIEWNQVISVLKGYIYLMIYE